MKKTLSLITSSVVLFGGAYLLFFFLPEKIRQRENSGVSIGEFWMYDSSNENPFKKEEIRCYKVLDVKNGYVKYLTLPDGYVSSNSVRSFKFRSKKIK